MHACRPRRVLLLMSVTCGALVSSEAASASCLARPLVLLHASSRTTVKLPAFLRATMICGGVRGVRGVRGLRGAPGKAGLLGKAGRVGASGLVGPTGPTGAAGRNGVDGTNGSNGANGANGATGQPGANGAPGQTGQTGQNGQTGPPATIDYAYVSDAGGQSVAVGADIAFTLDGPTTTGITHAPGTSSIVFASAGTFRVASSVSGTTHNQFGLAINGAIVNGTTYGSDDASQQTTGQALIVVLAGDVLTIRNRSATSIVLDNAAGGALSNVDASLLIERLA
jgi:Collagen triple helix repeat (20 copies)